MLASGVSFDGPEALPAQAIQLSRQLPVLSSPTQLLAVHYGSCMHALSGHTR